MNPGQATGATNEVKTSGAPQDEAYRPQGTRYSSRAAAVSVLGRPNEYWPYGEPQSQNDPVVLRYDRPEGASEFKVLAPYAGGWYVDYPPAPYPLFRKDSLATAKTVYVCQSEQSASAAESFGLRATTPLGGHDKAELNDWSPLKDKDVVVISELGDASTAYADDVAQLALAAGAETVRIYKTESSMGHPASLTKWIDLALANKIEKEQLPILLSAQSHKMPSVRKKSPEEILRSRIARSAATRATEPICLSSIAAAPLKWIWTGVIPRQAVTLITGDAGVGKSLFSLNIAAAVSRGERAFDQQSKTAPERVIMMLDEDHLAMTVRPRLDRAGADTSQIYALCCRSGDILNDNQQRGTPLDRHLSRLDDELIKLKLKGISPGLIVVDPLASLVGSRTDFDPIKLMSCLSDLAEQSGAAIVVVLEEAVRGSKSGRMVQIRSLLESAARSVWSIVKDADDPNRRMLLPVKVNLCEPPAGIEYSIHEGKIDWGPNCVPLTVDEFVVQQTRQTTSSAKRGRSVELARAMDWLRTELANGRVASQTIYKRAEESDLTYGTIRRACRQLECQAKKCVESGHWYLELNDPDKEKEGSESKEQSESLAGCSVESR